MKADPCLNDLREDFSPDSDTDMLVEFEPGKIPGLSFFTLQNELSDRIGRIADLNTLQDLSSYFRERVSLRLKFI